MYYIWIERIIRYPNIKRKDDIMKNNKKQKQTTYKIKSKFFCQSCKKFLYEKYIGEECIICGAVRCEFCSNENICNCDD